MSAESLHLFSIPERMKIAAEVATPKIEEHWESGAGLYYDDTARDMAREAIQSFTPELFDMRGLRVAVDAQDVLMTSEDDILNPNAVEVRLFNEVHVEARFKGLALQAFKVGVDELGLGFPIEAYKSDIFAVLRPVYRDAEPDGLVLGDELYVPFRTVQSFKPVENKAA